MNKKKRNGKSNKFSTLLKTYNNQQQQIDIGIFKKWQFWLIVVIIAVAAGSISSSNKSSQTTDNGQYSNSSAKDYTNEDAKTAYDELIASGYSVKFIFDRNNNGGFSDSDFQKYVLDDFSSDSYTENPYVVTKYDVEGDKSIVLYIEFKTVAEEEKAQAAREEKLEQKLGIVESMTACQRYGERNYRNFKMHSILGKIAEYAKDDDTWFLKYYVDVDGYKNRNMECYVTGTSDSPQVINFLIY